MYCDQILNPDEELSGFTDSFCDELGLVDRIRRSLFERKGIASDDAFLPSDASDASSAGSEEAMTDAQIDEALKKVRDIKKQ